MMCPIIHKMFLQDISLKMKSVVVASGFNIGTYTFKGGINIHSNPTHHSPPLSPAAGYGHIYVCVVSKKINIKRIISKVLFMFKLPSKITRNKFFSMYLSVCRQ